MATFYDDFERADGSLGGNWTLTSGNVTISGGYATSPTAGSAVNTTISEIGRLEARAKFGYGGAQGVISTVIVKSNNASNTGYGARLSYSNPNYIFQLVKGNIGAPTVLASETIGTTQPFTWEIAIVYDDGDITATLDGGHTLTAQDLAYSGNTYAGIYAAGAAARIAEVTIIGGAAVQLDVTPSVIGNYGTTATLTASGTNTSWSAGTPGTPVFTCNHGSITSQTVDDTDTATLTFDPGAYLGDVTFTDPSTGATDTIVVTSDPGVVPPTSGPGSLPQSVIDWLVANAANDGTLIYAEQGVAATHETTNVMNMFTRTVDTAYVTAGATPGSTSTLNQLVVLWRLINGLYPVPTLPESAPADLPLAHNLDLLQSKMNALTGNGTDTLDSILNLLGGEPFASHATILTELRGIPGADNQELLDAILAVRGLDLPDIRTVVDLIGELSTAAGYNMADVLDAISGVRGTNNPSIATVMAKLALIQPGTVPSLVDIDTHIVQQTTLQAMLDLVTAAVTGTGAHTIADVLNTLGDLSDQIGTVAAPPSVRWPGLDNVTLGTSHPLADDLTLDGPMHGVLVTITAQPAQTYGYHFAGVTSWSRVGQVIFATDRGDWERSQTFALDSQILVPVTMEQAQQAIFRVNPNWEGTARTWLRV